MMHPLWTVTLFALAWLALDHDLAFWRGPERTLLQLLGATLATWFLLRLAQR